MATMPAIDDDMVDLFRRTGKRRTRYSTLASTRAMRAEARVVPQALHCPPGDVLVSKPCNGNAVTQYWCASDPGHKGWCRCW